MSRTWKIATRLVLVGFCLPLLMLAYQFISGKMADDQMLWLCPASILSMALNDAPIPLALLGWLLICTTNAVLYASPTLPVFLILSFKNRQ